MDQSYKALQECPQTELTYQELTLNVYQELTYHV